MPVTPAHSVVFTRPQIGKQTVLETGVAAGKILPGSTVVISPDVPVDMLRPGGMRIATAAAPQKGMASGSIEKARINLGADVAYWLSGLLGEVTAVAGVWTWLMDAFNPNPLSVFTLERGQTNYADKVIGAVVTGLEFTFSRTEADVSGSLIAQQYTPGASMTASPTYLAMAPALAGKCRIRVGNLLADLSTITTFDLPKAVQATFGITGAYREAFYLNEADNFTDVAALAPTFGGTIAHVKGVTPTAWITDLKAGTKKFLEIYQVGPYLAGSSGPRHTLQIRCAFTFGEPSTTTVEDLDCDQFAINPVYDSGLGSAVEVILTTNLTAL